MEKNIQFTVNGASRKITVDDDRMLLWVYATIFTSPAVNTAAESVVCGACTVLLDQKAVRLVYHARSHGPRGKSILTIEGLSNNGSLHPLQKAFVDHDALQCGYCTPG